MDSRRYGGKYTTYLATGTRASSPGPASSSSTCSTGARPAPMSPMMELVVPANSLTIACTEPGN